jgi:membrane protein implicated in regulation of membrane protease activity
MIPSLIDNLGPWSWIVLGLALMGLELVAPGAFLLWLGFAAMLTGMLDWWLGLSWQAALLVFAALSVASVLAGRAMTRDRDAGDGARPPLNRHAQSLVGSVFTLEAPIAAGSGRIRVDDSSWRVVGPDAPAGASVRVVRVEGATLVVAAA